LCAKVNLSVQMSIAQLRITAEIAPLRGIFDLGKNTSAENSGPAVATNLAYS
jgi:hypothetical protein